MPNVTTTQKKWLITAGLCLLVLATYTRVVDCGFLTYDDDDYVTTNAHVQGGLNWHNLVWAFKATEASNWHPLTWISHIIYFQIYGMNATGHHITNLVSHIANVILLFWMLQYITGAVWRSAVVAALFAVHPLNVESVAWVAERKNVLSTLFWILTLWAYAWYALKP